MKSKRHDGRFYDQLRKIQIKYNIFEYASSSILLEVGKTKVLCAVTLQNGVPPFLRGKGSGWLTAEYALLPAATISRTPRESSLMRKNGRSVEISRFIGRSLRTAVDLSMLGERTITIDCDVLQADGSTRTVCITAAYQALQIAQERWLKERIILQPILNDRIVAVSVGVIGDDVILDPDYQEDSTMMADYNFVLTESGKVIEILGGAEKEAVKWDIFNKACSLAQDGVQQWCDYFNEKDNSSKPVQRSPLFSLKNRQTNL